MHTDESKTILLVRQVVLAVDGIDAQPSKHGYRELSGAFIAKWAMYCSKRGLAYIAVHNHLGDRSVSFSSNDLQSHERNYPSLAKLVKRAPVGAFVFAERAVAGDIWFPDARAILTKLTVAGAQIRVLTPALTRTLKPRDEECDRHYRIFGEQGQELLRNLKVGVIGLGGGGSLLSEWLSRLGVGQIVGADPKTILKNNRLRVVGALTADVRNNRSKAYVARRVAKQANPIIQYEAIHGDVRDQHVADRFRSCDAIFLAGDTFASRNVFNRLIHQFLIPGFNIGTKIEPDLRTGVVKAIRTHYRVVLPQIGGGCLDCNGLIPEERLRREELSPEEIKAQAYFGEGLAEEVPEPSVITLNVLSAAQAVTDFMLMFTGLYPTGTEITSQRNEVLDRRLIRIGHIRRADCPTCSSLDGSSFAMGDEERLPCRMSL
jgi:hypothetical protein